MTPLIEIPKSPARMLCRCEPDVEEGGNRELSTYFGPAQVAIWPVLDLQSGHFSRCNKTQIEQVLGSSAIKCLKPMEVRHDIIYRPGSGIWIMSEPFRGTAEDREYPCQSEVQHYEYWCHGEYRDTCLRVTSNEPLVEMGGRWHQV
ncbi:hypothetical protein F5X99DRAFT_402372 [Biscogniauxia marginata]|nr:hypothetical protein F5X99DRAFT_402372 [Biscogniauxia marginata]